MMGKVKGVRVKKKRSPLQPNPKAEEGQLIER
jgi:hypothetical protein